MGWSLAPYGSILPDGESLADCYDFIQIWRLNHFRILLNRKILLNDQKCLFNQNSSAEIKLNRWIGPNFGFEFDIFDQKTLNKWFYLTFRWRNRWWNFVADVPNRIPEIYFKRNASGIRINHPSTKARNSFNFLWCLKWQVFNGLPPKMDANIGLTRSGLWDWDSVVLTLVWLQC